MTEVRTRPGWDEGRPPLTVLIPGVGLLGGLAGGIGVGLLVTILSAIETGGIGLLPLVFGAVLGPIVGTAMGVAASLLRITIGVHFGLTGELIAVVIGAIGLPLVLAAVFAWEWSWIVIALEVIGALAAWQFCRTVLKRARQQAPEIGNY